MDAHDGDIPCSQVGGQQLQSVAAVVAAAAGEAQASANTHAHAQQQAQKPPRAPAALAAVHVHVRLRLLVPRPPLPLPLPQLTAIAVHQPENTGCRRRLRPWCCGSRSAGVEGLRTEGTQRQEKTLAREQRRVAVLPLSRAVRLACSASETPLSLLRLSVSTGKRRLFHRVETSLLLQTCLCECIDAIQCIRCMRGPLYSSYARIGKIAILFTAS